MMKKHFALTLTLGALLFPPGAWAGPVVQIMANGFVPSAVTIPADDTITWTNKDTVARQVVSDAGAFKSPLLKPGESYTYNFPAAGTYSYRGAIKPDQRGTVNVRRVESRAVTIGLSKRVVTSGQSIELAGSISSGEGGKEIRVLMTPYRGVQTAESVITEADGTLVASREADDPHRVLRRIRLADQPVGADRLRAAEAHVACPERALRRCGRAEQRVRPEARPPAAPDRQQVAHDRRRAYRQKRRGPLPLRGSERPPAAAPDDAAGAGLPRRLQQPPHVPLLTQASGAGTVRSPRPPCPRCSRRSSWQQPSRWRPPLLSR